MIRCIAIDDEPLALTIISSFCKRKGGLDISTYSEPHAGLDAVLEQKPDIVFLDIEMNSLNGLDIARKIPDNCLVIFTTAHAQFALEGFNLDAVDFLHKPIAYERFETAIDKAVRRINSSYKEKPRTITVKQEYESRIINTDEIMYIEAMENYSKIHLADGSRILSRASMKSILDMLPTGAFVRVHKSYIVSARHILSYCHNQLTLSDGTTKIPIGRRYYGNFSDIINKEY